MKQRVPLVLLSIFVAIVAQAQPQNKCTPDPLTNKTEYNATLMPRGVSAPARALIDAFTRVQPGDTEVTICFDARQGFTIPFQIDAADGNLIGIVTEVWNGAWLNDSQELLRYSDGSLTLTIFQDWNGSEWVNDAQIETRYDEAGNIAELIFRGWENEEWVNSTRQIFTLDDNGNLVHILTQEWENGTWVNLLQTTFTISSEGNIELIVNQFWENGAWTNIAQNILAYDAEQRVVLSTIQTWNEDLAVWQNAFRDSTVYNQLMSVTYESIGDTTGMLTLFRRVTITYNDQMLIVEELAESNLFGSAPFMNEDRVTFSYEQGRLVEILDQEWDPVRRAWINNILVTSTYDADGDLITELGQLWDGIIWANVVMNTYIYGDGTLPTSTEQEMPGYLTRFDLYPIPSHGQVFVNLEISHPMAINVEIYDLLGRQIAVLADEFVAAGTRQLQWNAQDTPNGMYFVRLKVGDEVRTRMLTVID